MAVRKQFWLAIVPLLLMCAVLLPDRSISATKIKVVEAAICRGIQDRTPIDAGESFIAGVPKLYCFTKLESASIPTSSTHVWYYGTREMARVTLPVNFHTWRTYSSITFYQDWPGEWNVAVLAPTNEILKVLTFIIERKKTP